MFLIGLGADRVVQQALGGRGIADLLGARSCVREESCPWTHVRLTVAQRSAGSGLPAKPIWGTSVQGPVGIRPGTERGEDTR